MSQTKLCSSCTEESTSQTPSTGSLTDSSDKEPLQLKYKILLCLPTFILTIILVTKFTLRKQKPVHPITNTTRNYSSTSYTTQTTKAFSQHNFTTKKSTTVSPYIFPPGEDPLDYSNMDEYDSLTFEDRMQRDIQQPQKYGKKKIISVGYFGHTPNKTFQVISPNHGNNISFLKIPVDDKITALKIHTKPNEADGIAIDLLTDNDGVVENPKYDRQDIRQEVRTLQGAIMEKYMDRSTDPCEDFYQFSCGNWKKHNPIPPDKIAYDTFEVLRERLDQALRNLLGDNDIRKDFKKSYPKKFQEDPDDAILKVRNFYRSCMNEELLTRRSEKPLLKLLKELGGWPIINPEWDESQFDWLWLMAQLRLYNNDILISEWVGPDIRNANEYIIQFDQTTLGLPSKQYFLDESNSKYLEAYRVYMITIACLLGAPIINATQDVEDILNFEMELAMIIESPDQRKNISEEYSRVTVGELHSLVPQIEWLRYLNIVTDNKIQHSERIVSFCTEYFQNLVFLLSQTPQRTIANYLLWRFVRNRINNLDNRFQEAKQRFYYILFGREKSPPRWQTCITQVNSNMGMGLGSLFVQKYFDEESRNDTVQMTMEIQQTFREILSNADWLDEDTKILARVKIDAMILRIGYPDFIVDKQELAKRYKDVEIYPDRFFENTLSILRHLTKVEHLRLGTVVDKLLWTAPPAVVNAYYSRNKNQIMFPAGILQPPFYQKHFPRALNYGGIGVVIGHEITHGFDDKGRLFDKEGNLHRWWKDNAVEAFHNKAQCLIDQYNKYIVSEVNVQIDGLITQGENIADNGGLKEAYRAFTKWLIKHPQVDESLPGLELSATQLFFLNFAQVWCGSSRIEGMENKLKSDVHAPGRYRVIGSLSNSDDFSNAFNCPQGSPMNPIKKCSIW